MNAFILLVDIVIREQHFCFAESFKKCIRNHVIWHPTLIFIEKIGILCEENEKLHSTWYYMCYL